MKFESSRVRFRNNKPYLLKKVLITLLVIGISIYCILSLHWLVTVMLFCFTGIPLILKIRKQPTEGKGFFGKVKNYYKNMYKDYVIDFLPMELYIEDETVDIKLEKAEYFQKTTVDEYFHIQKSDIAGILYDDIDKDILIVFEKAKVTAKAGDVIKREIMQSNGGICFSILEHPEVVDILKDKQYDVEYLSEIQNEQEETEDPELSQKNDEPTEETENTEENNNDHTISGIGKHEDQFKTEISPKEKNNQDQQSTLHTNTNLIANGEKVC